MIKMALIGYGKMGRTIERLALEKGHEIRVIITEKNLHDFTVAQLRKCDVAIEFTHPDAAWTNAQTILRAGLPLVSGTTGWNEQLPAARDLALQMQTAFLHASNFSIGVNLFFELNQLLARLMSSHEEYHATVKEIHHTEKKDAPSGTAITLANQILAAHHQFKSWALVENADDNTLPIIALREDSVPGTHYVTYDSAIDRIEIVHTAHNREGFALGAIAAAEYIADKQGVFTMRDVLGF